MLWCSFRMAAESGRTPCTSDDRQQRLMQSDGLQPAAGSVGGVQMLSRTHSRSDILFPQHFSTLFKLILNRINPSGCVPLESVSRGLWPKSGSTQHAARSTCPIALALSPAPGSTPAPHNATSGLQPVAIKDNAAGHPSETTAASRSIGACDQGAHPTDYYPTVRGYPRVQQGTSVPESCHTRLAPEAARDGCKQARLQPLCLVSKSTSTTAICTEMKTWKNGGVK